MFINKLSYKFAISIACLISLTASILSFFFILHAAILLKKSLKERANALVHNISYNSEYGVLTKNDLVLNGLTTAIMKEKDVIRIEIVDIQENVLSSNENQKEDSYYQTEAPIMIAETSKHGKISEEEVLFPAEKIEETKRETIGTARLRMSLHNINHEIKKMVVRAITLTLTIVLGAVLLSIFLVRKVVRPIKSLVHATRKITAGDLTIQADIYTKDEIGELASSFNEMARELNKARNRIEEYNKTLEQKVKERTSEIEKLHKTLLQSEKMSAVGQLAAGISHEINNPLGVILGFAQSLAKKIIPGEPLELPIKSIEREAKRCKHLVQDLLTFSRTSALDRIPLELNVLVESVVNLVEAHAKIINVEVKKDFAKGLPLILGNSNQIQQVIINLANNALDAMPQLGTLTFRTQKVEKNHNHYAEIQIQDTGHGIPKDIQPKIFDPFFTTKEPGKGTGLGLSLAYEIVQKHSGTIEVESEENRGTIFHVLFPLESGQVLLPRQRLLIVEDNQAVAESIEKILEDPDFEIHHAEDGFKAGKLIMETKPNLVILDIFLPGVDGFEICQIIRSDGQLKRTKILAISGMDIEETRKKILKAGADDFMGKPLNSEELKKRVKNLLSTLYDRI